MGNVTRLHHALPLSQEITKALAAAKAAGLPQGQLAAAATPPPPMRGGAMPHAPGVSVALVVLVFLSGVVIGAKMAGGW